MIGKTLGHYQITSQIGKGGMGEDVTPTGKPAEAPRKINIVVNWFEELKQRAPGK